MIIQSSSAALTHSVLKSLQWWQTHLRAEQWHSGDVKANQRADQLVQVRFMLECVRVCAQMRAEASPVGVYKKKKRKKKAGRHSESRVGGPSSIFSVCPEKFEPNHRIQVHLVRARRCTCRDKSSSPARLARLYLLGFTCGSTKKKNVSMIRAWT